MNIRELFLENIGIRQTIFKNTFWLTAAEVVIGFLRLGLLIYVARILGATEYGKFTFAFSFVSVIVIFSDLGVIDIITREFSRDKEKEKEFPKILTLNIVLSFGALAMMIIGSFFITSEPYIQRLIWILACFIVSTSFFGIFLAFLRGRQKMEYEAGIKIIHTIILVGVSFLGIFYFPSAIGLGYGYLIANLFSLIVLLLFFHFRFQRLRLHFDKSIFNILKIAWPLSLGYVPIWIYITVSSIMLGYFNLITENGWYNAAAKIALIAMLPAELIIRSFYPVLSKFFVNAKQELQKSWDYLMSFIIFLVMPTVVGGVTLAPKMIDFFYGPDFGPSIFLFQLMMVVVGFTFINYPFSVILIISDHQAKNFFLIIAGVLVNIALGMMLIPLFGLYGAIVSVMASSLAILLLTMVTSKNFVEISLFNTKLLRHSLIAGLFSCAMFFVISNPFIYRLNIFYSAGIGAAMYGMLCLLFYKIQNTYGRKI